MMSWVLISVAMWSGTRAEVEVVRDYKGWGWTSYVMSNGLVRLAVVPEIGGRVMEYSLEGHNFIYINPQELGKTYVPSEDSPWHNFGGYKVWPAPQGEWLAGGGGWPPPPNLDFGRYSCEISVNSHDSSVVLLEGPPETFGRWKCRGLKFKRRIAIYRGSTRVRVEQAMENCGREVARWSVWDVTQVVGCHPGEEDYGSFWVYFPVREEGRCYYVMMGEEGPQWKGRVAEGVSAVQYLHHGGKIGADSDGGWICYVDERDGYAYVKTFEYFPGETYPDSNASVEVFTSSGLPYVEVEVLSPLVELAPGGSYTFVEDWYATRCRGPILKANRAGVVRRKLKVEAKGGAVGLEGEYGVFYIGRVEVTFEGTEGESVGESYEVSPLETFVLKGRFSPPSGAERVVLRLYDGMGKPVGILDSCPIPPRRRSSSLQRGL
ncbi:MAG TPA: DUF4380 domain-containing protein [Candidatus Latescibacteria bacterium]|nr:DUF4380 domain-containing protein [Candidatus Latescibacterota bacterium]